MTDVLIAVFLIVLFAAAIAGMIYYAPFIPAPFKQIGTWAVGAVALILVLLQVVKLFGVAIP